VVMNIQTALADSGKTYRDLARAIGKADRPWIARMIAEGKADPTKRERQRIEAWLGVAIEWRPVNRGGSVLADYLERERWDIKQAAANVGVTREHLSRVVNGRVPPSNALKVRIKTWTEGAVPLSVW